MSNLIEILPGNISFNLRESFNPGTTGCDPEDPKKNRRRFRIENIQTEEEFDSIVALLEEHKEYKIYPSKSMNYIEPREVKSECIEQYEEAVNKNKDIERENELLTQRYNTLKSQIQELAKESGLKFHSVDPMSCTCGDDDNSTSDEIGISELALKELVSLSDFYKMYYDSEWSCITVMTT